jgi:molybdate transport repressor ModE-like protein
MRIGAVITAAGMSSRMGDFKPLLKIGLISMIQRIVANFQQARVFPIVIVTGFRGGELEKHISKSGVIFVRNDNYEQTQMFDSAKIGFSYIMDKCDRVFFTPVDIPLFKVDTVKKLMTANVPVAKPVCRGAEGHPIILACSLLPQLLALDCDQGLRRALSLCCDEIQTVEVDDEGILIDADTPADYHRLLECHNRQMLRPFVEILLMRENKLFDKTGAMLLRMVAYTGSVKDACHKTGISYSAAWGLLDALEDSLGFTLIDRQAGGECGGGSCLTAAGRELMKRYVLFTGQVQKFADSCFADCFKGVL